MPVKKITSFEVTANNVVDDDVGLVLKEVKYGKTNYLDFQTRDSWGYATIPVFIHQLRGIADELEKKYYGAVGGMTE